MQTTTTNRHGYCVNASENRNLQQIGCVSFQGVIFRQRASQTKRESKGSPDVLCIVLAACPAIGFLSAWSSDFCLSSHRISVCLMRCDGVMEALCLVPCNFATCLPKEGGGFAADTLVMKPLQCYSQIGSTRDTWPWARSLPLALTSVSW